MVHPTQSGRLSGLTLLFFCSFSQAFSQPFPSTCTASAVPTLIRSEGVAERLGDILLECSGGTPGTAVSGNLNILLPVNVTNRVNADGAAADVALTLDTGAGPVLSGVAGRVTGQNIAFNGVSFTIPASGRVALRVSNLRANVNQMGITSEEPVRAYLSTTLSPLALANNPVVVGRPRRALYATLAIGGIRCVGSPAPAEPSMSALFAAGTRFASARLTEGYAGVFERKDATTDTGTRILVRYTGIPAGARLFVPDVIAGSSAVEPTGAGDLGGTPSGGKHAPSAAGSLLLARVVAADGNGAGGRPVFTPGAPGSGEVAFRAAAELPAAGGTATAVYEVMDANPLLLESFQMPTFVAIAEVNANAVIQQSVSLAPLAADPAASQSAPVPRFAAGEPGSDCAILGDCDAAFFPRLSVSADPLRFTALAGGAVMERPGYIAVQNKSGGLMSWTATVSYKNGAGWLTLSPESGVNNRSIMVYVSPQKLAAGDYAATITVDAGPLAGVVNLPVSLKVGALPPVEPPPSEPAVRIAAITNAADFVHEPLAPGELAVITGSNLGGDNVRVYFDELPARVLSAGESRIEVQVPLALGGRQYVQLSVMAGGVTSKPIIVTLNQVAPAVFRNGILNQDGSPNGPSAPAAPGSVVQVFATGLAASPGGAVWVKIHDVEDIVPQYAGPAPGLQGVEQINVRVPDFLPAMQTSLVVCALVPGNQRVCSHPAPLLLGSR